MKIMHPVMHHLLISSGVELFKGINIIAIGGSVFFTPLFTLVFTLVSTDKAFSSQDNFCRVAGVTLKRRHFFRNGFIAYLFIFERYFLFMVDILRRFLINCCPKARFVAIKEVSYVGQS